MGYPLVINQFGISRVVSPSPHPTANQSPVGYVSVAHGLARSTRRVRRTLRPRWREVTGLRARAASRAPTHSASQPETTMNLDHMLAQLRGTLPAAVPHPESFSQEAPRCVQRGCTRPASIKADGEYAKSCKPCRIRRAKSCKRRRKALIAQGGCRRCAYRKRLAGDFLCQRCRDERDAERAQKRQDAIDAATIDQFAAKPDKAHRASNLDLGVSPWNAERPKPEPSAGYWSPLPDPDPAEQGWRWSLMNGKLHHRY